MSYDYYDRDRRFGALDPLRDATGAAVGSLRYARDHAFEAVSETAHDVGRRVQRVGYATSGFVSTHAVPLALLGVGVGLLVSSINRQRTSGSQPPLDYRGEYGYRSEYGQSRGTLGAGASQQEHGYRERATDLADSARERATDLAGAARERAGALADRAAHGLSAAREQLGESVHAARNRLDGTLSELGAQASGIKQHAVELGHDLRDQASQLGQQASQLSQRAYDQLQRAEERTAQLVDENPLMVGALALAAGVGVGLLLPATSHENRLLGQTRDQLLDEAQRTASRFGETFQRAGGELKDALLESGAPS